MTNSKNLTLTVALAALLTLLIDTSCASPGSQSVSIAPAQMWADNCSRCHGFRDPGSLSDSQWGVAMRHMRVRANLTAAEHDGILEFLQASN